MLDLVKGLGIKSYQDLQVDFAQKVSVEYKLREPSI
jgi:hypothetical protein